MDENPPFHFIGFVHRIIFHCVQFSFVTSLPHLLSILFFLFFRVCVLFSSQGVWALIWNSSEFWESLPSWLDFSYSYWMAALLAEWFSH